MKFILIDDQQRCNFCVYWTGKRAENEAFDWVDFDTTEWGICLCQEAITYGKQMASCEGCTCCEKARRFATSLRSMR